MTTSSESEIDVIPGVHFLTDQEAREIFDKAARYWLDMSGEEFLAAWDAGEFEDKIEGPDHDAIMAVVMLIPLGR